MSYDARALLVFLSRKGALERFIEVRTEEFGRELGYSQQTASIYLSRLASEGYIERTMRHRGSKVCITGKGLSLIFDLYSELEGLFGMPRVIPAKGRIAPGLGEGAYYLSQSGYIDQVMDKLGFRPYPGTLNIVLSPQDSPVIQLLRNGPGIVIEPFESDGRTFGRCLCYHCTVSGTSGAVMVPNRTIHKNTLEIISDIRLRDLPGIRDEAVVDLSVVYPGRSPSERS